MTLRRGRVNRVRGPAGMTQLSGDVVAGPGTGNVPAVIPANSVHFAQMQDIDQSTLIGRGSRHGRGDPEQITVGPGLTMTDRTLSAVSFGGTTFVFDPQLGAYTAPR